MSDCISIETFYSVEPKMAFILCNFNLKFVSIKIFLSFHTKQTKTRKSPKVIYNNSIYVTDSRRELKV